jgi:hypothetical protein
MRILAALACALVLVCAGLRPGHAEKRLALVIGNDRYANLPAGEQLRKAVNDARAVGDALESIGFQVIRGENLGRPALVAKFDELTQRLEPGDTAFFFFAGHGVAVGGGNYILPADVPKVGPGQDTLLARVSLGEADIVADLQGRGVRVAIVVLDACRNNPFKKPGTRGVGAERGLARIEPVRGVFSIYSAGIGQTALDRLGDTDANANSVFTRVFAPALKKPGLSLGDLAVEVREEVARLALTASHDQLPAYYDQTTGGRVYLAGAQPAIAQPPAIDPAAQAWAVVQNTTSVAVLEDFIRQFGGTPYGSMARARLEELKKQQLTAIKPPVSAPAPEARAPPNAKTVRLRALIDGRSIVTIQNNKLWWHHLDWAAPGRWDGRNEATTVNGSSWYPTWPQKWGPDVRCGDCSSSSFDLSTVGISLGVTPVLEELRVVQARSKTNIKTRPSSANGYLTEIELDDNASIGADIYEVILVFGANDSDRSSRR